MYFSFSTSYFPNYYKLYIMYKLYICQKHINIFKVRIRIFCTVDSWILFKQSYLKAKVFITILFIPIFLVFPYKSILNPNRKWLPTLLSRQMITTSPSPKGKNRNPTESNPIISNSSPMIAPAVMFPTSPLSHPTRKNKPIEWSISGRKCHVSS